MQVNLCLLCRDIRAEDASGLARATADLAQALHRQGHSVHLVTNASARVLPDLPGVSLEPAWVPAVGGPFLAAVPESAAHNLMIAAAMYREVARIHEHDRPVDAVLAPLWRSEGVVCALDDRFPTIVTCMTSLLTLTELDGSYHLIPDIAQRLALERETLARSPYLHGLTRSVLAKTIRDYGLTPAATAVIGRGLEDRADGEASAAANGRWASADHRGTRVLFVGRIEPRKGVDTLIAAARELVEDGVPVSVLLAGPEADPTYRQAFERQARDQPRLGEAVRFVGAVSDPQLYGLYRESDIVCVPSRYESHGIVPIEAMMFGKPLVTFAAGGLVEVATGEGGAVVCDADDAVALANSIRRLAEDPTLRAQLGAAARLTFEQRFAVESVAGQTDAFIAEVVALHRGRESGSGSVSERLAKLLSDALGIEPAQGPALAGELLDPVNRGRLADLREAALAAPASSRRGRAPAARIAALVVSRERPRTRQRAVDSLAGSLTPVEVIVVEDAGERRRAIESLDQELLLLLDDDAELLPGALEHLLAELESHPQAAAVAATVVAADGRVSHSGGSLECSGGVARFAFVGAGLAFTPGALPASGPAGWVPWTAVLVRRECFEAFPIDQGMDGGYGDAEWSFRVSLERPEGFRRCAEALAFHRGPPELPAGPSFGARSHAVHLLAACARFHDRHGLLMVPWVCDLTPEFRAQDGSFDLVGARLLMDLITAQGEDWIRERWTSGELAGLLGAHRREVELQLTEESLRQVERENLRLTQAVRAQEETLEFLHARHETLRRVEEGGWWRLRSRVLPAIRLATRVEQRLRRLRG